MQPKSDKNIVKPVWNDPVCKDHFSICENSYLPLDSMQNELIWNDHLPGKTMFP